MDLNYLVQEPQRGEGKDEERARPTCEKRVGSVDIGGEKVTVGGDVPLCQAATSRRCLVASRTAPRRLLACVSRLAEAIRRCRGGDEIWADLRVEIPFQPSLLSRSGQTEQRFFIGSSFETGRTRP
ncbi:hypothetical protein PAHAL_6G230100 [Panicum hallii]|jgi:negative regulator of sigma E activity|uniref:Uncharacterized protein n=1 Tax=Panicum hallii TaxID=206008 RepID=A0A2S3I331_9POAL|nr:hypothetical protein PAHAL_6G230100 [Panicum hallii]